MINLGRYKIDRRVGEGALSDVYCALDPEIGRAVAVKVLKPQFAQDPQTADRFVREAHAAGALSHPNIATIYDVGQMEGSTYIAMELIEGQSLDVVMQGGRLPYERVLAIGLQIASALAYAHAKGVVHRDIKPSNIMLCADGKTVKLLDFGVARIGESDAGESPELMLRTQVGQLIGTPRYMSPEQALGMPVDHRSDLFSLGIVLYEMVTGKVAFRGAGLATLAVQIVQENVQPIDRVVGDCPSGLRFIIDKLLAKKPEQRFANGDALVAALQREIEAARDSGGMRPGISLRIKLPLVLALVTALALGICVPSTLSRESMLLEQMAVTSGNTITAFVANNAAVVAADNAGLPAGGQDWSALQAFAMSSSHDPQIRTLEIVDDHGVVRAANNQMLVGRNYHASKVTSGSHWINGTHVANVEADGKLVALEFERPISYAGARFGMVHLELRRTQLDGAIDNATMSLVWLSAIVMIAVLFIGYLSGAMVTRPLARLCKALNDAAGSGFAVRISHARGDEFGVAFKAFNDAASEVEGQLGQCPPESTTLLATRVISAPIAA